jgi:hypothetical protein
MRLVPGTWVGLLLVACGGDGGFEVDDAATPADATPVVVRSPDSGPGGVGATCDPLAVVGPSQSIYNVAALECPSRICMKPAIQPGASATTETGAFCSATCTQDTDCAGQVRDPSNPLDTRCQTGFTCGIIFVKGHLCCMPLCVCKDFIGSAGLSTPIACQGDAALTCNQ